MKRYWKITLLVPFILICLGTYYINADGISYPDYYIKTQTGDEREAVGITFQANYTNQSLSIRTEGSAYQSEEPYWDSLTSNHFPSVEFKRLQQENRSFMRGKKDNPAFYYEDELVLGYAEIESRNISGKTEYHLISSAYDKKQKNSSSFEMNILQEKGYQGNGIYIYDVQFVGSTMNVITINNKEDAAKLNQTEIHLYKLDMVKKSMTSDQVLLTTDSTNGDNPVDIKGVYSTEYTKPNRYAVFQIVLADQEKREVESGFTMTGIQELVYYDLASGKLVPIQDEKIKALMKKSNEITYSHDELVLSHLKDPQGVRVIRYSLAENKLISELVIDTGNYQSKGRGLTSALIINNRLYLMGSLSHAPFGDAPTVIVANPDTGAILYEGYISRKDNKAISNLMINRTFIE